MPYELRYSREAVGDLRRLRSFDRAAITDQIQQVLTAHPARESKVRVKRLRQPAPSQYRLRVGGFRVFYDVEEGHVNILRIMSKEDAILYLEAQ